MCKDEEKFIRDAFIDCIKNEPRVLSAIVHIYSQKETFCCWWEQICGWKVQSAEQGVASHTYQDAQKKKDSQKEAPPLEVSKVGWGLEQPGLEKGVPDYHRHFNEGMGPLLG